MLLVIRFRGRLLEHHRGSDGHGRAGVVTDVGDSARIVGDAGRVVQPGDEGALKAALLATLDDSRADAGLAARLRARIEEQFGSDVLVDSTLRELGRLVRAAPGPVACGTEIQ